MVASRSPFPTAPLLASDGRMAEQWRIFFLTLFARTGSDGGFDAGQVLKDLRELALISQAQVAIQSAGGSDDALLDMIFPGYRQAAEVFDEFLVPSHGIQDEGDLHALATATTAGFMSAADKAKFDSSKVEDKFVPGTGAGTFNPGVSTALTLSKSYAAPADVLVFFDSAFQGSDQYSVSGNTITFTAPIPVGISTVYARG